MLDLTDALDGVVGDQPEPEKEVAGSSTFGPLYFDIETIPDFEREELFGLDPVPDDIPQTPDADMISAEEFVSQSLAEMKDMLKPKNPSDEWIASVKEAENKTGKKPRKGVFDVLAEAEARRGAVQDAIASRNKTMGTTPEFCRVVAIGVAVGSGDVTSSLVLDATKSPVNKMICNEHDLLYRFWQLVANHRGPLVGYNVLGFDLPVMFARSALLGAKPPRTLDMRPWGKDVIDLMKARYPHGPAKKLKDLAKWYGIEVPAGDVDGSQVLELYQSDPEMLARYVRSDVEITRQLHGLWRGTFC